jgi:hypothetical protein
MREQHASMGFAAVPDEFHSAYYYCGLYLFLEKGYSTAVQKTAGSMSARGI